MTRSASRLSSFLVGREEQVVWGFVGLGLALRLIRYLLHAPLWGDECMLAVNFLDRGYAELLDPLENSQIAPPLFLWIELTAVKLLGFSELSLRLFPTCASIASLFLFRSLAGKVASGLPRIVAVGIFAVSYYPIRHGAEVKQYASDLLVSLVLLILAVHWSHDRARTRWIVALWLVAPFAVCLSHTSAFVAGAIALAFTPSVWRDRARWSTVVWFVAFGASLLGSFLLLYAGHTSRQQTQALESGINQYWAEHFPPISRPAELAPWLLESHTGHMFAYPVGGNRGGSALTSICVLAAVVLLGRQRRWLLLGLLLAPLGLMFLAAALHKYPYAGSTRVTLFCAPAICLLAGIGAAMCIHRCRELMRARATVAVVLALAAIGAGVGARDVLRPHKTPYDRTSCDFARWFWTSHAHGAELVCVEGDLGIDLRQPGTGDHSSLYRCYQRIYSRAHSAGRHHVDWNHLSADRPLRCVVYRDDPECLDEGTVQAWLAKMDSQLQLVRATRLAVNPGVAKHDERYDVYEFVPKSGASPAAMAACTQRLAHELRR